jgi:multiple sugar transport system substrate-binding protein
MKRSLGIALILALAFNVAVMATGSGEASAASKGPVELNIWMGSWWSDKAPLITAEFQKLYPNYKLKIDTLPINGYFDNAAAAILAGGGPDILDIDITQVATFASKNLLTDITADVGSKLKAEDFLKVCWEYSQYKGKMYGMPNRGTGGVYYYNKTMFDDVGLAYPKDSWNWDDMLAYAKKITVPGQKYGVGIAADLSDPNNVWSSFAPVLWGYGGEFMNADVSKTTLDTPNSVKGITYWLELYTRHKVVPEGSIGFTISRDFVPLLAAGKVAMLPFGVSGAVTFDKTPNLKYGVVQVPSGFNRGGGWTYTVPVTTKKKKEVDPYLLWFAKPEVQAPLCATEPSNIAAWQLADPWKTPLYQAFLVAGKNGKALPNTGKWGEASTIIIKELQKGLQGQKTPEQVGKDATSLVDAILKQ